MNELASALKIESLKTGFSPRDAVKLVFQSVMGPGHLIANDDAALARLRAELAGLTPDAPSEAVLFIGGGLCRLPVDACRHGLAPETLFRMFKDTAGRFHGTEAELREKLCALQVMADDLNLDPDALAREIDALFEGGLHAVSHSETYRTANQPAYRVADALFGQYLPLFTALDAAIPAGPVRLAVDGRCGSGKTTLAEALHRIYGGTLINMDDYFLPFEKRTPARYSQPGGNVDYERFRAELLDPLLAGRSGVLRPFDCHTGKFRPEKTVAPDELLIVEGSYSLHTALRDAWTLRVFLSVDPETQLSRLAEREGADALEPFVTRWIPLEEAYISAMEPARCAQLCFE